MRHPAFESAVIRLTLPNGLSEIGRASTLSQTPSRRRPEPTAPRQENPLPAMLYAASHGLAQGAAIVPAYQLLPCFGRRPTSTGDSSPNIYSKEKRHG